jgi:hypothetical protein
VERGDEACLVELHSAGMLRGIILLEVKAVHLLVHLRT